MQEYLNLFITKHDLSNEFENCLRSILLQSENTLFSELGKFHFQLNGGIETENINKVFKLLDLLITFTDIVDDVEDKDATKWKEDESILINASTTLISIIMLELQSADIPFQKKVIQLFFQYLLRATDGQHHDLLNNVSSEDIYIEMVIKKSGSLIALACTLGETLATGKYRNELEKCAYCMGVIAQLNNDYEDLLSKQKDIRAKKMTLPILYLLKYNDPISAELRDYYQDEQNVIPPTYIALEALEESGLCIYISFMRSKYRQLAMNLLEELYPGKDTLQFKKFIL